MAFIIMRPWDTPKKNLEYSQLGNILLWAAMLFMLLFIVATGGTVQSLFTNYSNLVYLLFMLVASTLVFFSMKNRYASTGETKNAIIGTGLAIILGLVVIFKLAIGMSTPLPAMLSSNTMIAGIFIILVVPLIEEKFFGRTLPFFIQPVVKNPWITLAIVCLIFAGFHTLTIASSQDFWGMFAYKVIFRAALNIGNEKLKTSMFGNSFHYLNNAFAILK